MATCACPQCGGSCGLEARTFVTTLHFFLSPLFHELKHYSIVTCIRPPFPPLRLNVFLSELERLLHAGQRDGGQRLSTAFTLSGCRRADSIIIVRFKVLL